MLRAFLGLLAAATLSAAPITFSAQLLGPNEEPPNASPGTGFAVVTIDDTANTLFVSIEFEGLLGPSTAAHIHVINGPGDTNTGDTVGPVATTTPTFTGFPLGVMAGTYSDTLDTTLASTYRAGWITDSGGTAAAAEAALFLGIIEGRAYVNVHSSTFPGGEIRGFLEPVPEPGTLMLMGTGLAALGLWRRRAAKRS